MRHICNQHAAEEDEALRTIVGRDGEGKWKLKANELNHLMEGHYKSLALKAKDNNEPPVEYGRVAAQCLHRLVVLFFFFSTFLDKIFFSLKSSLLLFTPLIFVCPPFLEKKYIYIYIYR